MRTASQVRAEEELRPEIREVHADHLAGGLGQKAASGKVQGYGRLDVGLDGADGLPAAPKGDGRERGAKVLEG